MEGGCACGLIRYRLETQPLIVHCCHCTSCQRETGTAFALNAVIESSMVTLLPSSTPVVPANDPHAIGIRQRTEHRSLSSVPCSGLVALRWSGAVLSVCEGGDAG
ncbi:conserved hypothetical protein [Aspergillus fumigatus A1163]|uniref:CENP-V/GFA domain-containing protein n=1 Tax=Aspergillus fumigatus (strain CBS 144.89 / FGSC A1163 / CEA10) TaxID=451804 RepID=B0YBS7_ASPFC|nr:conserved hypothetical protein [Aspergillus fumigatus A1163]